jgi:hypothetical protein
MPDSPPEIPSGEGLQSERTKQLRRATRQLEKVLESLDLNEEPQLADEVIEALRATERAYEIEIVSQSE